MPKGTGRGTTNQISFSLDLVSIANLDSYINMKKFYITIIDSGWPTDAHDVCKNSLKLLKEYLAAHNLVIFSEEESQEFLREHPEEIGKDPIIIITDVNPKKIYRKKQQEVKDLTGIRIDLGKSNNKDEAIRYLQQVCRMIEDEKFVSDISWDERRKIARSFLKDIVEDLFTKWLEFII